MISLTMNQNDIILALLHESDDPKSETNVDTELLLQRIQQQAKVDLTTADSYVRSWKHNKNEGAIGAISRANERLNPKHIATAGVGKTLSAPIPSEGGGKIAQILALHDQGMSTDEIIKAGFNKSTVYRQVSEYKKRKKAAQNS